ncbi:MAG: NAD(P)/FAD-dependent oxidoreductase [Vicinamibacteria bacterium]
MSRRRFMKAISAVGGGGLVVGAGLNALSPRIWPGESAFDPNVGHWAASQPRRNPPLAEDIEADVAIIGGGYTGLSAAYYIRKRGPTRRVVVLEASGCGNGASGRNGAMLLTLTADRYMQPGTDWALDKRIYDLTTENIAALRALSLANGADCDLETRGSLQVLNSAADVAAATAYVAPARKAGIPVELWDRTRTAEALGTALYEGALFDPSGGQLHPMKLVRLWKTAALAAGAAVYEGTPVVGIEEGAVHRLRTAAGRTVRATSLVLATNAYTSKLGYLRNAVAPIHNYVAITPPLQDALVEKIGWRSRLPFSDSRTLVHYLGITPDNRIHIGGGRAEYSFGDGLRDRGDQRSHDRELRQELLRIFPALADVPFDKTWSGVVDVSLDFSPAVGQTGSHGRVYYGIGYSGHGVNLSSLFGRIIADLEGSDGDRWKGLPFVNHSLPYLPNEPFRWLGVHGAMAYYRVSG